MIHGVIEIDGEPCPVTNLFDSIGDETDDIAIAVSLVAQLPDGQWAVVEITDISSIHPLQ